MIINAKNVVSLIAKYNSFTIGNKGRSFQGLLRSGFIGYLTTDIKYLYILMVTSIFAFKDKHFLLANINCISYLMFAKILALK